MNAKPTIDELKSVADTAEREAQEALKARKVAVAVSVVALKAASKARQKYLRAAGAAQGEGNG